MLVLLPFSNNFFVPPMRFCLDLHTLLHQYPSKPCSSHAANLNIGSPNVRVGGIPWGRVGDSADAGAMISGSVNVLVNGK